MRGWPTLTNYKSNKATNLGIVIGLSAPVKIPSTFSDPLSNLIHIPNKDIEVMSHESGSHGKSKVQKKIRKSYKVETARSSKEKHTAASAFGLLANENAVDPTLSTLFAVKVCDPMITNSFQCFDLQSATSCETEQYPLYKIAGSKPETSDRKRPRG